MPDKNFWTNLAKDAGVPAEQVQALEGVLSNDAFAKKLEEGFARQSDYSRNMDTLAAEKAKVTKYYNDLLETTSNQQVVDQVNAQLAAYRAEYGDLGGANAPKTITVNPDAIDKKTFDATINQIPLLLAETQRISFDYYSKFGEPLNMGEVLKINAEKGLPLSAAYDSYIAPKVAEKQTKEWENKLANAKKEGADEYARTHQMPIDSKPADSHFLFDRPAKEQELKTDRDRVDAFRDFFRSPEMAAAAARE